MPALFRECPAVKVWEFQNHYVLVKHTGVHTCHPVPPYTQRDEQVKENVEKRLDLPPKRIQREAISDQLYSGKTIEEVKSKARAMIDTKKISPVKRIQSQSIRPFGHSLDALKRLKQETKKTDKYLCNFAALCRGLFGGTAIVSVGPVRSSSISQLFYPNYAMDSLQNRRFYSLITFLQNPSIF